MDSIRKLSGLAIVLAIIVAAIVSFVGHSQQVLTLVKTEVLWYGGSKQLPSESRPGESGDVGAGEAWWKFQCSWEGCGYHDVTVHVQWSVPQQVTAGQEIVIDARAWGQVDVSREGYKTVVASVCGEHQCASVGSPDLSPDNPNMAEQRETIREATPATVRDKFNFRLHVRAGPLDAYVHYFYESAPSGGQAPRITSLR